jgi:hypothetical protein
MGDPNAQQGFPRLTVRIAAVALIPTPYGVSFRMLAEARGRPTEDHEWKPSLHLVQFPIRPAEAWLTEGKTLEDDIEAALRMLSDSIAAAYLPYEKRQ